MIFKNLNSIDNDMNLFDGNLISDLTKDLDKLANFKDHPKAMMKHYVEITNDISFDGRKEYPIKVTNIYVGSITIDKNKIVDINITIGVHELIKYHGDIDSIKKYKGELFEVVFDDPMLLSRKRSFGDHFVCSLTKELDKITEMQNDVYCHYLLIDEWIKKNTNYGIPIRIPGCTVGGVWINAKREIVEISIESNNIITYPDNINEIMKKYIGVMIDYENL